MKNFLKKNLIKKLCLIAFIIYVMAVFINQQQTLNSYESQKEFYSLKIDEAEEYNTTLLATKENLESDEYIETICREKLDMYSPNERIYININK